MKDVELARQVLSKDNQCLVVVKKNQVLYKSTERGILPLYKAVLELGDELSGASIADRVIGKGAALLCVYAGIREIHAGLISKPAQEVLKNAAIKYAYDKQTEFIQNRDKTGMCPIETRAEHTSDPEMMLVKVKEFLELIEAI